MIRTPKWRDKGREAGSDVVTARRHQLQMSESPSKIVPSQLRPMALINV